MLAKGFFKEGEDTEQAKFIEVLALFSSPKQLRNGKGIPPLQLMREIVAMQVRILWLSHVHERASRGKWPLCVAEDNARACACVCVAVELLVALSTRRWRGGCTYQSARGLTQAAIPRRLREIRPAARFPVDIEPVLRQVGRGRVAVTSQPKGGKVGGKVASTARKQRVGRRSNGADASRVQRLPN